MIVKTKAFADRRAYIGSVGRAGENAVRALEIDCADVLAEYPDAEIIAVIRRAQGDPYTVALEKDGAVRRLVFLEADYKYPGRLEIELRAIDGDKILKSAIYAATVEESIQGESDTPGQPVRDVLDRLETEIAAAQAVVDDIRQKLDSGAFKGEKGEPGSGATIIPATNAEIDTHTDAAHVLAPSNMDYAVKAAMTDGKGAAWTAAEQQAARDRMGLDKPYALIEEIVFGEDSSVAVERTTAPDGTPYSFSVMRVQILSMPSAKTGIDALMYFGNSSHPMYIYTYITVTNARADLSATECVEATLRGGYWMVTMKGNSGSTSIASNGSWTGGIRTTEPSAILSLTAVDLPTIESLLIIPFTGEKVFPSGTIIRIYGVRT